MRTVKVPFFALVIVGGIFIWRNRFAIQRQLESFGIKTPLLNGNLEEAAHSVASKASGKLEHGVTMAENMINRKAL